jgi:hypothetical protein
MEGGLITKCRISILKHWLFEQAASWLPGLQCSHDQKRERGASWLVDDMCQELKGKDVKSPVSTNLRSSDHSDNSKGIQVALT